MDDDVDVELNIFVFSIIFGVILSVAEIVAGLLFFGPLLTLGGPVLTIGVIALIWFLVSQIQKRKWERGRPAREKQQELEHERGEEELEQKRQAFTMQWKAEGQRRREKLARELAEDALAYGDLPLRFEKLMSSATVVAEGVHKAESIAKGHMYEEDYKFPGGYNEVSDILVAISGATNGASDDPLGRFGNALFRKAISDGIMAPDVTCLSSGPWRGWANFVDETENLLKKPAYPINDMPSALRFSRGRLAVGLLPPKLAIDLARYDKSQHTQWASEAALIFQEIMLRGCAMCPSSPALQLVAHEYINLLFPYLPEKKTVSTPSSSPCQECQVSYSRLGIPLDATFDEIKQIYRDLCNVWHPDRFEHNERLKDKATKEFQEMQQAYEHISSHFAEAGYSSGN